MVLHRILVDFQGSASLGFPFVSARSKKWYFIGFWWTFRDHITRCCCVANCQSLAYGLVSAYWHCIFFFFLFFCSLFFSVCSKLRALAGLLAHLASNVRDSLCVGTALAGKLMYSL